MNGSSLRMLSVGLRLVCAQILTNFHWLSVIYARKVKYTIHCVNGCSRVSGKKSRNHHTASMEFMLIIDYL